MNKKYKLIKLTQEFGYYRIVALRDFGFIKAGEEGGKVSSEKNLSHYGTCWIKKESCVTDNARVSGNASIDGKSYIQGNAMVYGNAIISGSSCVKNNAKVFGAARITNCTVTDNAKIYGNADCRDSLIFDSAQIYGFSSVFDNSCVKNKAKIYGNAIIKTAKVENNAIVRGGAKVLNFATVGGKINLSNKDHISFGHLIKNTFEDYLFASCNLVSINDKIIAYKWVSKISDGLYKSFYDNLFFYRIGETAVVAGPFNKKESCGNGIHASHASYWVKQAKSQPNATLIALEIDKKDVICIQSGKIRCKRAKVIGEAKVSI